MLSFSILIACTFLVAKCEGIDTQKQQDVWFNTLQECVHLSYHSHPSRSRSRSSSSRSRSRSRSSYHPSRSRSRSRSVSRSRTRSYHPTRSRTRTRSASHPTRSRTRSTSHPHPRSRSHPSTRSKTGYHPHPLQMGTRKGYHPHPNSVKGKTGYHPHPHPNSVKGRTGTGYHPHPNSIKGRTGTAYHPHPNSVKGRNGYYYKPRSFPTGIRNPLAYPMAGQHPHPNQPRSFNPFNRNAYTGIISNAWNRVKNKFFGKKRQNPHGPHGDQHPIPGILPYLGGDGGYGGYDGGGGGGDIVIDIGGTGADYGGGGEEQPASAPAPTQPQSPITTVMTKIYKVKVLDVFKQKKYDGDFIVGYSVANKKNIEVTFRVYFANSNVQLGQQFGFIVSSKLKMSMTGLKVIIPALNINRKIYGKTLLKDGTNILEDRMLQVAISFKARDALKGGKVDLEDLVNNLDLLGISQNFHFRILSSQLVGSTSLGLFYPKIDAFGFGFLMLMLITCNWKDLFYERRRESWSNSGLTIIGIMLLMTWKENQYLLSFLIQGVILTCVGVLGIWRRRSNLRDARRLLLQFSLLLGVCLGLFTFFPLYSLLVWWIPIIAIFFQKSRKSKVVLSLVVISFAALVPQYILLFWISNTEHSIPSTLSNLITLLLVWMFYVLSYSKNKGQANKLSPIETHDLEPIRMIRWSISDKKSLL